MKKYIYTAIISLGVLFASCDYVSNPFPEKNANVSYDTALCPATFPADTSHVKKILIEDYTGHTCSNCPRAARILHNIDSTYPGKIIGLAIPCSSLAAPSSSYIFDYRTTVGNTYDAQFINGEVNGLPNGMINRKDYDAVNFTHRKFYLNWQSYLTTSGALTEPSVMDLQIQTFYDATTRKVYCSVRDSILNPISGTYKLVVLISQDNIIDWQDDIDHNPVGIPNYVHNHILRDAITPTGAWGEPLIGSNAPVGLTQVRHFAYTIPTQYFAPGSTTNPTACDVNFCHIVAYIYNTATYEIIQSEEVKVN